MNETQKYELEMARDTEPGDQTPEQRAAIKKADIGGTLESERATAVNERRAAGIDDRLIRSYQLYEGMRDSQGRSTWQSGVEVPVVGSRAYANIIRQITNDGAAQIGDLLFPNDDRNYGLKPLRITKPPIALEGEPAVDSKGKQIVDEEGQPLTNIQAHSRRVNRSKKKTERMFTKLDGALITARYPSKAREVIANGAIYGTGIIKGPIPTKTKKGRWVRTKAGGYSLNPDLPMTPDVKIVSPLDFFPDATAITLNDCRYTWERAVIQPADLERAVVELGYDKDAVDRILLTNGTQPSFDAGDAVDEAKAPVNSEGRQTGRYMTWQRHGPMKKDDLEALGVAIKESTKVYHNAIVTMCNGEVLKAVTVAYENDESLYSVYNWDVDPLNIFGYGIPWLMSDQQAAYVAAWRMALDNGGLSAAPQVLIDKTMIDPVDGKWQLHGGKAWYIKENTFEIGSKNPPFQVVQITQNLKEIFTMMDRAVADAYEITGVTRVDNAQQGLDNAPVTLGATQILQNNTSVSRRAQARRWDDCVTLGIVTRFYDYFMQFEADDDIKANMEVEPRGATVLLAKELTATNTIQLYQMTGGGEAEGSKGIDILRGLEASMQIPAGTYIETPEETDARAQAEAEQAEQGAVPDPMFELEQRKVEVLEANVELQQARDQLAQMIATQKAELDAARFQLEDALASANMDDKTQQRMDSYHSRMAELDHKRESDIVKLQVSNKTTRDVAAAKVNNDSAIKNREDAIKEREVANKERELSYKMNTGNEGI